MTNAENKIKENYQKALVDMHTYFVLNVLEGKTTVKQFEHTPEQEMITTLLDEIKKHKENIEAFVASLLKELQDGEYPNTILSLQDSEEEFDKYFEKMLLVEDEEDMTSISSAIYKMYTGEI